MTDAYAPANNHDEDASVRVRLLPYWHTGAAHMALRDLLRHLVGYRLQKNEYLDIMREISIMQVGDIKEGAP